MLGLVGFAARLVDASLGHDRGRAYDETIIARTAALLVQALGERT
ncbi:hypothetical protein AB0K60_17535 [Thermopolyspora sp. NPDC052614]